MPPKKAKKISLNEFLGNSSLGSWADEMETLPNAPAPRNEDDQGRSGDRYGRRDDFLASRPDRASAPPREDIPLPTQAPYTAFIGNLAFDLTESELEDYFAPAKAKSVKIIKDREDKPKGFGYIEFENLDGLKDALLKSGSHFSGRTIRVSVAEPPKERPSFGGASAHEDDAKFDNPWRRDGPLPDRDRDRDPSRRRFDGPPVERLPSVAEGASEWRSNRSSRTPVSESESASRRRGSGFSVTEGASVADQAEVWTKGSKFVPSVPPEERGEKYGSMKGRSDMGPSKESSAADEGDWRRSRTHSNVSPGSSTPPTPPMSRRKLELLPRSGNTSVSPSPLSSPRMAPMTATSSSTSRASPFGAAKPVDVSSKEKEVSERIEKERDATKEKLSMSRTNSRTGYERTPLNTSSRTPPPSAGSTGSISPKTIGGINDGQQLLPHLHQPKPTLGPSVRPNLSFANAAARKRAEEAEGEIEDEVEKVVEKVAEAVF